MSSCIRRHPKPNTKQNNDQREKLAAARQEEDRAIARDVRGKFVEELWGLAREFRIREQEQAKADQLGKKLARLEGVEADLREAERYTTQQQQYWTLWNRP